MSLDVYLYESPPCPHCAKDIGRGGEIYWANITHNLAKMASEAGIYETLWLPDEHGMTHARHLVESLRKGLAELKARPEYFEQFNAANGWGLYEHFVPFVEKYLAACEESPDAIVRASR